MYEPRRSQDGSELAGTHSFVPGQKIGRFRVESVDSLAEYQSRGILFSEELSGAQIYHVHNEDEENFFSFNFRTLPANSTGVAHILEHTVFCGSEKYPVKDPFFMLYKGSMQTFLNAMTFADRTTYPAASAVKQDLFNLMSVYADAVFFPLLRKEHFLQEGHRLVPNSQGGEIAGIVYNEMKAHYSTQDAIAQEWCCRSLLPDTPYAHDSGGDPAEIPSLTYADFCSFHKTHYHPANCLIFFYGNIASENYLSFLDDMVFSRFTPEQLKKHPKIEVPLQPAWKAPRTLEVSYPVSGKDTEGSSVNLNWLLPEPQNSANIIANEILNDILIGRPASPMQKLILESDLGADMSSCSGLDSDLRQPVFTIGMRGTSRDKAEQIETLILTGLEEVVEGGLNADLVQASLRSFEFRSREIKGGIPFGLRLLLKGLKRWFHGEAPTATLGFTPYLADIRNRLRENPNFFTDMVRDTILQNPHRSRLTTYPDREQNARDEKAEQELIAHKLQSLGENALADLKAEAKALQQFQQQEDRPEDLATVPFLTIDDIPRNITVIPHRMLEFQGHPLYLHELFTNGISYINLNFDISQLTRELQLFVPFLCHLLPQLGTTKKSYTEMTTEWGLKTGGFFIYPTHFTTIEGSHHQHACIRLKTLDSMSAEGIALLQQILRDADFSDHRYLWEIFNEYRNDFRSGIIPNGVSYASIRAKRGISPQAYTDDLWQAVIQSRFIEMIAAMTSDMGASFLAEILHILMELIFDPAQLNINLICNSPQASLIHKQLAETPPGRGGGAPVHTKQTVTKIHQHLPALEAILTSPQPAIEGIAYSSKVNFTALSLQASPITQKEQLHEQILCHVLSTGLLHEKIRVKGGAYGAFCSADPLTAAVNFGSYRDPAITESWAACEDSLKALATQPLDSKSLNLAKISLAGKETHPLSPLEKGSINYKRICCGITDDLRKQRRAWLIGASGADIQRAAQRLSANLSGAFRAVLADPTTLNNLYFQVPELQCTVMSENND